MAAYRLKTGGATDMNDRQLTELARAYRDGDRSSFKELVDMLTRPLIATAYRYTRDWETARDLTQDTWVRVHEAIQSYEPDRPFRYWLYAVHRNICLSHLRRSWVRRETPMEPETISMLQSESATGEEGAEREEFFSRLFRAIAQLSDSQRQVFCRVDVEQLDQREAAELLGIKFTTLRSTLHFARRRLARILREMEDAP